MPKRDCRLNLFRRCVVERSSLVHDMNGQIFQGRVANDLHSGMWNVAVVDGSGSSREFDLFPVWCFNRCSLKHIECLLTMMNVTGE
jgi:hypothetical protein